MHKSFCKENARVERKCYYKRMEDLIEFRKQARDAKNWEVSDKIRNALDEFNIILKDSKDGTTWDLK